MRSQVASETVLKKWGKNLKSWEHSWRFWAKMRKSKGSSYLISKITMKAKRLILTKIIEMLKYKSYKPSSMNLWLWRDQAKTSIERNSMSAQIKKKFWKLSINQWSLLSNNCLSTLKFAKIHKKSQLSLPWQTISIPNKISKRCSISS